jgi:exodeoxyribonuclease V alpha subunit
MLGALLALRPELRLHLAAPTGKAAARLRSTLQEGSPGLAGPLALEGTLVRWRRWQQLRQEVLEGLTARAQRHHPLPEWLPPAEPQDPWQRLAIRTALERDLLVLAGGPGTGKTSTVAHILEAFAALRRGARLHLAAPTGKAAARLRAATNHRWPCTTLHQLLESRGEGEFRRNRERPLQLDLLVVDEVSMVDLALMQALLVALPESTRLVLVGDPAQLPPVAPGAPMEDLLREELQPQLEGAVVTLRTTYRNAGAIAAVASALREQITGRGETAANPIAAVRGVVDALNPDANLHWHQSEPGALPALVLQGLREHLLKLEEASQACTPGTEEGWPELVGLRDQQLVLTPRHRGPWGVDTVHRRLLGDASAVAFNQWPSGTPVLCTRNLHGLGLSNGDLGVLVVGEERWLVFGQDQPIWLHPSQLTGALEPALALTVHKAQGSEAERVMVLLPDLESTDPRLLYTALTRAREEAWLLTPVEC